MFGNLKFTIVLFFTLVLQLLFANSTVILAQRCYTDQYQMDYYNSHPLALQKKIQVEQLIEDKGYLLQQSGNPFIIPVVVHVVYKNSTENISVAQINSQIDALNRDFRKLNSDVENTPALFYNLADDCNIEFRLAQYDPQGNPTTGITRTQTSRPYFWPSDEYMKFSSSGGHDIWDRDRYLNIWVCDLQDAMNIGGYTSGIGWNASIDGVVIDYMVFGTTGTLLPQFNLGRTAVHEVGHWLGLYHLWGHPGGGGCDDDDDVYDTPVQDSANFGCPSFPSTSCNNESDMFMNYMDYVDDACMFMFTSGQKQRIQSFIFVNRSNLNPSLNLSDNIFNQVPANGGNYSFVLQNPNPYNSINWSITKNVNWITNISPISGTNGATVTFSVSSNTTGLERAGIITIQTDDIYQSHLQVFVFQKGSITPTYLSLTQGPDLVNFYDFGIVGLYRMGEWKYGTAPKYYEVENGQPLTMQFSYGFWPNTHSKFYVVRNYSTIIGYENYAPEYPFKDDYKGGFIPAWNATIHYDLPELSGMSVAFEDALIGFKDPWYTDLVTTIGEKNRSLNAIFHYKSSPFEIKVDDNDYKGVFLDQFIEEGLPYYSVKAISPQDIPLQHTGKTHRFYFQNWGGTNVEFKHADQLATGVVFTNTNAVATANLKGTQLSNEETAYANNSQRKLAKDWGENLWKVYESLGQIWLEKNDELMNGGRPVNDLSQGPEAKSPCLDYYFSDVHPNEIYITYQQKTPDCKYKIMLAKFNELGQIVYNLDVFTSQRDYASFDAAPVIAVTRTTAYSDNKPKFCIVWRQQTESEYQDGLYYWGGVDNGTTVTWYYEPPKKLLTTDSQSSNPTIAVRKNPEGYLTHHVAWQQGDTKIKYCKIYDNWNHGELGGIVQSNNVNEISHGSGTIKNYKPLIIAVNFDGTDQARICWIGERRYKEELAIENTEKTVVFTATDNLGRYWTFGRNVNSVGINKDVSYYVIAWASDDVTPIKYTDSRTLGTPYHSLSITGKEVQLSNGIGETLMDTTLHALAFNTSNQPYYMQTEQLHLNRLLPPIAADEKREGILSQADAQVYFNIGEIKVYEEPVGFVEIPDTANINSLQTANKYLESLPFTLTDNSEFVYSVQYGLTDSLLALNMLSGEKSITFKVELLDAVTNEVIGVFDEVTYNQANIEPYEKVDYQVLTEGIGEKVVKMRLVIGSNFTADYSVAEKYDEPSGLAKKSYKQINYQGSLAVKEYALEQNYPNPFNPSTVISWQSPVGSHQTLKVYDVLGREVATLVNEWRDAGRYSVEFNGSSLASGVYIYQLRVNDFVATKKLLLIK